MQNWQCRAGDTKLAHNAELVMQDSRRRTSNTKQPMQRLFAIQNLQCKTYNVQLAMQNLQCKTYNAGLEMQNLQYKTCDTEQCKTRNTKLTMQNLQ